jgi:hypothetical protein
MDKLGQTLLYYTILHYTASVNMTQHFIPHPSTNITQKIATQKNHISRQNTTKGPSFANTTVPNETHHPVMTLLMYTIFSDCTCTATLHADLAYLHRYKTMDSLRSAEHQTARPIFLGKLDVREACILWDTGASTNFVSRAFVERHGLSTQPCLAPLKVSMGDGTTYDCLSSLFNPCLTMGPVEDDSWTLTVAPLQGVDVILGTPWWQKCTIRTLRIIRHDVQYAYLFVFLKRILPRHEK